MNASYGHRLKSWRKQRKLSQRELGSQIGVSQGYIGDIEAGRSEPSRNFLQKLTERFGVSSHWVLTGAGEASVLETAGFEGRKAGTRIEPAELGKPLRGDFHFEDEDFVMVRRMELSVSAGHGVIPVDDGQKDAMAFSRTWFMRHHVQPDLAVLVEVRGDSMAPTIPNGALILIDCLDKDIAKKGVFAFNREDESFVKRLVPSAPDPSGRPQKVTIISDNPSYPPDAIVGEQINDARIVGRVKCVISSIL